MTFGGALMGGKHLEQKPDSVKPRQGLRSYEAGRKSKQLGILDIMTCELESSTCGSDEKHAERPYNSIAEVIVLDTKHTHCLTQPIFHSTTNTAMSS